MSWLFAFFIIISSLGSCLNSLVIYLNNGMPVPVNESELYGNYVPLTTHTRLPFLADVIPGYWSVGDLLIISGLISAIFTFLIILIRDNRSLTYRPPDSSKGAK